MTRKWVVKSLSLLPPDTVLPPPTRLTMSKYSSDAILLQWVPVAAGRSSAMLLGYRVYVNGVAEGMVSWGRGRREGWRGEDEKEGGGRDGWKG